MSNVNQSLPCEEDKTSCATTGQCVERWTIDVWVIYLLTTVIVCHGLFSCLF